MKCSPFEYRSFSGAFSDTNTRLYSRGTFLILLQNRTGVQILVNVKQWQMRAEPVDSTLSYRGCIDLYLKE